MFHVYKSISIEKLFKNKNKNKNKNSLLSKFIEIHWKLLFSAHLKVEKYEFELNKYTSRWACLLVNTYM